MNSTRNRGNILPIAIMFALFFMIAFVTGLQTPLADVVKGQFSGNNALSMLGNLANFIAYLFMGIPAGLLLQRIGYKKTALVAVTVGFIGVSVTFLSGKVSEDPSHISVFATYLAGALISGFSMCLLNTVVNPMLNTLGGGGNRGNQLVQFGGVFNSVAATIVPVTVGYLTGGMVNPTISKVAPALYMAMGIFALAFVVITFSRIPEPEQQKQTERATGDRHSAWSFRHFVLGIIAIFLYVGIEVGVPGTALNWMKDSVNGLGMDAAAAGTIAGTYWFLMLIGRLIGGAVGAKVSSRTMLRTVSAVALAFVLIAMLAPTDVSVMMPVFNSNLSFSLQEAPIGIMFLVLVGLCTSVMWGGIFNLAVEGLGRYTSAASGIFMMMVCGGGIIPLVQGYVADLASYSASYWVIVVCLAYLLFYAFAGYKNVNKDIITN